MKSALGWILTLAIVGGGGATALITLNKMGQEAAYAAALAEIKRDFISNTSGLYLLEEEDYQREIGPHLTHYIRVGLYSRGTPRDTMHGHASPLQLRAGCAVQDHDFTMFQHLLQCAHGISLANL